MLKQGLELRQTQKLSPLQIQTIKLIELPTQELEQRIRKELEENPVLEENTAKEEEDEDNAPREVSLSEYKDDDPIPSYKLKVNNYGKDERPQYNTFSVKESFTQSPLTTDKAVLVNLMKDLKSGMIEDGTAIGLGLANAVNRIKDSKAKSKVIILLTDGVNNRGAIAPMTAAELAKTFGIRVYTIGVGSLGEAPYPVQTPWGIQLQNMPVEIDEDILTQIADMTGGKYFRATDNKKLEQIYSEIDQLEKSKIEVKHFSKKDEQYFLFALIGVLLLIVEALGKYTLLRKIP